MDNILHSFRAMSFVVPRSDLYADLISLLVMVWTGIALARLHTTYDVRRIMLGILPGITLLVIAVSLKIADDVHRLPWVIRFVVTDTFVAVGGIYASVTFIALIKRLYISSNTDGLTGCFNKDFLHNYLRLEVAATKRRRQQLSLLYIDVDNFKAVNDRMGHAVGDVLLREFARTIQHNVRSHDAVVRWGGDEFVVVLSGSDEFRAKEVAERIASSIDAEFENFYGITISVSIGIARFPHDAISPDGLIKLADERMYEAKSHKNQIPLSHP